MNKALIFGLAFILACIIAFGSLTLWLYLVFKTDKLDGLLEFIEKFI